MVSNLSRSPDESAHIEHAQRGGRSVIDTAEESLSPAPDLVSAASYSTRGTIRQLRSAHMPTAALRQFGGINDAIRNIELTLFGLFLDAEERQLIDALGPAVQGSSGSKTKPEDLSAATPSVSSARTVDTDT